VNLEHVLYDVDGAVATVTINRPEQRNALSPAVLRELRTALLAAGDDDAVRTVVLTGSGDKAFCAGADLSGFAAAVSNYDRHRESGAFVDLFLTMERLGKPIIGCINGHALAGGFGLALSCDLLVAADTATFGTPEIKVGVWPMMISSIVLRNLGRKRTMQLFLTGERLDAGTAMSWGIVNRVVPQDQVRTAAGTLAAEIAGWSPVVLRLGRDAFYDSADMGFEEALRYLHSQLSLVSLTDDFTEGVSAFLQKRPPEFKGR
jgi:enoyl-CoA hydratase